MLGRGGLVVPVLGTGGQRLARGRSAVAIAVGLVRLRLAVGLAGRGRLGLRGCRGRLGLARLGRGLARLLALGTSAVLFLGRRAGSSTRSGRGGGRHRLGWLRAGGDRRTRLRRGLCLRPRRGGLRGLRLCLHAPGHDLRSDLG